MAFNNAIEIFKNYAAILDEVYKAESLTAILDNANDAAREGMNPGELVIPKMSMGGLGTYNRNTGYPDGAVTIEYETKKVNYERGKRFMVDAMDNYETMGIAYGRLAGEFVRTKVVPEVDAFRLHKYATYSGIGSATGTIGDGAAAVKALRAASNAMDEAEVSMEGRILFATPTILDMIADMDTTKSRAVMERFETIQRVPQSRMKTTVTLTEDGYTTDGQNINFVIVQRAAVLQVNKTISSKVIAPDDNPDADAWIVGYRNTGIAELLDNKLAGVYAHSVGA
jgi:hypothetical protein